MQHGPGPSQKCPLAEVTLRPLLAVGPPSCTKPEKAEEKQPGAAERSETEPPEKNGEKQPSVAENGS